MQLGRPPNRIDLLTLISGVDFDAAWIGSVAGELDGLPVRFIGFDAARKRLGNFGKAAGNIIATATEQLGFAARRGDLYPNAVPFPFGGEVGEIDGSFV